MRTMCYGIEIPILKSTIVDYLNCRSIVNDISDT